MPGIEIEEARLLAIDADLLARQYLQLAKGKLSAEQRKQWAKEAAGLLGLMAEALRQSTPAPYTLVYDHEAWNKQMREGKRPVTYKAP